MTLQEYFNHQGQNITLGLKDSLRNANRNASNKTSDSIGFEVKEDDDKLILEVSANSNIRFLQDGRKPTKDRGGSGKLKDSIRQWIKDKPITAYKGANGRTPTEDQLVFLITRKIHREGYEGTPGLIDNVISDSLIDLIAEEVGKIMAKDFKKGILFEYQNKLKG